MSLKLLGRPTKCDLTSVEINTWTSKKKLINLMTYLLENGRIKPL